MSSVEGTVIKTFEASDIAAQSTCFFMSLVMTRCLGFQPGTFSITVGVKTCTQNLEFY